MYLFKELPDSVNKYIKSLVTRFLVCTTRPEAAIVDGTFQLLPFNGIAHSIRLLPDDVKRKMTNLYKNCFSVFELLFLRPAFTGGCTAGRLRMADGRRTWQGCIKGDTAGMGERKYGRDG